MSVLVNWIKGSIADEENGLIGDKRGISEREETEDEKGEEGRSEGRELGLASLLGHRGESTEGGTRQDDALCCP